MLFTEKEVFELAFFVKWLDFETKTHGLSRQLLRLDHFYVLDRSKIKEVENFPIEELFEINFVPKFLEKRIFSS